MYEDLARYFGGSPSVGPNAKDIAKFIVLNADVKQGASPQRKGNEPSFMGKLFDILSRPNYAVANFTKGLIHADPDIRDIISGLSGTQKVTFRDVLKEAGVENNAVLGSVGLALDVGLDPTTYIPGAAIAKGISKVRGTTSAGKAEAKAAAELADRPQVYQELPTTEVPSPFKPVPELPTIKPTEGVTSTPKQQVLDLPGVPQRLELPEIKSAPVGQKIPEGIAGQLPLKLPDFKVSEIRKTSAETIDDLEANLEKVIPVPKPVPTARDIANADNILSRFRPGKTGSITRAQLVKLYNDAIKLTRGNYKRPSKARTSVNTLKTYIAAEQKLKAQGFKPPDGVWLSDVITKVGPEAVSEFSKVKDFSATWQAIQDLKATQAVIDAPTVQKIAEGVGQTKAGLEASNQLSDAQLKRVTDQLRQIGKQTAKDQPISADAVSATEKLMHMALHGDMSPAQIAVEGSAKMLDEIISTGKANPKANAVLTRGLEKDFGRLPSWAVNSNKVVEFFMGRIATWWGQKDLRPLSLNQIASSIATAAARGQALDHMFTGMDVAQRSEVWRLAQGLSAVPSSPEVAKLAKDVSRMMDNLLGRVAGTSVIGRSGVTREMLNKWMRQYKVGFEFTKGRIKNPITGESIDLSKHTDWLDTWRYVDIPTGTDAKSFIFKIQQAVEQATREKALFDEIGERFGSTVAGKGFRTKLEGHPYLEGYHFTEDIAKQLPRVIKDWTHPGFQGGSGALGLYDRVLSMWKAGVTIYRPGHHIRNMVGDVYLGWMDGVNTLRPYKLAVQVQRSMRGIYQDLMDVDHLVAMGVVAKDMATPLPGKILFRNKSGVGFTAEQIGAVAHQKGLLEHARTIEDIIDLGQGRPLLDIKPFGGRVQKVARGASELQSHNARLAHFIDKISKSRGNNLEEIFEQASRRARKWHPTGLDMTDFEKKVLRRIIPFYSWLRKSTPLLLEGLVMNPGKAVIPSKIYQAMQTMQGIQTPGRQDPFPVDQMFPEWMRLEGLGPVGKPNEGLLAKFTNQQPPGYSMLGMGLNPLTSLIAEMQDPGRTLLTGLTPAIQVPVELASGKKLFTGEPITGPESRPGSFKQYIGEQLPIYGGLQGILGMTPFGSQTKAAAKSDGGSQKEALTNFLTGLGVRGSGPYRSQARFEALAPGMMKKKVGREEFLAELRRRIENGTT